MVSAKGVSAKLTDFWENFIPFSQFGVFSEPSFTNLKKKRQSDELWGRHPDTL
jgi:hypothetical protein